MRTRHHPKTMRPSRPTVNNRPQAEAYGWKGRRTVPTSSSPTGPCLPPKTRTRLPEVRGPHLDRPDSRRVARRVGGHHAGDASGSVRPQRVVTSRGAAVDRVRLRLLHDVVRRASPVAVSTRTCVRLSPQNRRTFRAFIGGDATRPSRSSWFRGIAQSAGHASRLHTASPAPRAPMTTRLEPP